MCKRLKVRAQSGIWFTNDIPHIWWKSSADDLERWKTFPVLSDYVFVDDTDDPQIVRLTTKYATGDEIEINQCRAPRMEYKYYRWQDARKNWFILKPGKSFSHDDCNYCADCRYREARIYRVRIRVPAIRGNEL